MRQPGCLGRFSSLDSRAKLLHFPAHLTQKQVHHFAKRFRITSAHLGEALHIDQLIFGKLRDNPGPWRRSWRRVFGCRRS